MVTHHEKLTSRVELSATANSLSGKTLARLRASATSGAVSSLPDVLSANAAVQVTTANKPTGTTLNGRPAVSFDGTDDWLAWPVSAANNHATRRWLSFWFQPATVSGLHTILGGEAIAGVSANALWLAQNGTSLILDVYHSAFVARRATWATQFTNGLAQFYSIEIDLGQAAEADQVCLFRNAAGKQAASYSDSASTPGAMPASLVSVTGSYAIGVENISTNLRPLSGLIGQTWHAGTGAGGLSGGGLLTAAERALLMNAEPGA